MAIKRLKKRAAPLTPSTPAKVPVVASDGQVIVSAGKYARNIVLSVFEQIGGQDAMAEWATANKGEYYTKLFAKTITREVEDVKTEGLEDLLEAIDADCEEVKEPGAIDAEFESVGD